MNLRLLQLQTEEPKTTVTTTDEPTTTSTTSEEPKTTVPTTPARLLIQHQKNQETTIVVRKTQRQQQLLLQSLRLLHLLQKIQINLVILVPQRHQVRQVQMVETMGEVANRFFQTQVKLLHLDSSSLEFLS